MKRRVSVRAEALWSKSVRNLKKPVGLRRLLSDNSAVPESGLCLHPEKDEDQDSDGDSIPAESDEGVGLNVTEQPFYGDE